MFQNYSVRLPTRHIQIDNFSQQESEKLFDICTKRKVLHVCIDDVFYANCDLRHLDVLKFRQVQYIECVRICHNQHIRLMSPADLDDVSIINTIEECILTIFRDNTKGHILLYCDENNDHSQERLPSVDRFAVTPNIPIPISQNSHSTNSKNPFSTNSQNPFVARRHRNFL